MVFAVCHKNLTNFFKLFFSLVLTSADEGISGKNIVERPAINKLIDDIKGGKVNNVLVFKVDRLTRSTKNLIELVELFEEYDCAFNSLTEKIAS